MTEPPSSSMDIPAVGQEVDTLPVVFASSISSSGTSKRSATEAFERVEDHLQDKKTTLDDVLVACIPKKSKLLDEELPDVDDNEEFPSQTEERDEELTIRLEKGDNEFSMDEETLVGMREEHEEEERELVVGKQQEGDEGAASEDEEREDEKEIDLVDGADDDDEEEGGGDEEGNEVEEEEEEETVRAIARAQNQREARELVRQLDDSTRSKLCLTAMEKYGEELFYGHEDARDAILVDACAQDAMLSLMRDAVRVKELYLKGSSAAAPLELDDEEDEEEEGEDEIGGYEDEEEDDEDDEDDEEEKSTGSTNDNDDDIVVISEEEEEDGDDGEALKSRPGPETTSGANGEEVDMPHSASDIGCAKDGYGGEHSEQVTMEGEALGNVGAADDSASGLLIDEEGSPLPVQSTTSDS